MLVHPWDAALDAAEWRDFVSAQGFGQLIATGRGREVAVVVPTQYVLDGGVVLLHLARPNPIWAAIEDNPLVLLAVSGDWAYIPAAWKAIGEEDPARGIPTTYYAAAQLRCRAEIIDDRAGKFAILRRQLAELEPGSGVADPAVHERKVSGIRGLRLAIEHVTAKFKYGGNVDAAHRDAVAQQLAGRDGPGDAAARAHLMRRLAAEA